MSEEKPRFFNLSMQSITIESKDHFSAGMEFFNLHKGIGLLMIQEMNGPEKIGHAVNIRNTFEDHDKEIIAAVESALELANTDAEHSEIRKSINVIKKLLLEAEINQPGKF